MKVHPTAIVHPKAKLADDVEVGPFAIIGGNVTIGSKTEVGASCVIEGRTSIGRSCRIFTGAVVGTVPQSLRFKGEKTLVVIGDNNTIREYVTINPGTGEGGKTLVGSNNLLMAYSHIAHDCIVGDHCVIANGGTLAGHVTIEDRATVGGLVAIHQFVRVGTLSIIGGCSKVVQDIPPYSTCDGHPTKIYGINGIGLRRAEISSERIKHLKHAFKILFNSGLSISHGIRKIEKEISTTPEISHLLEFIRSSKRGICR